MNRMLRAGISILLLTFVYSGSEWTQIYQFTGDEQRVNLVDSDIYTTTITFHTDGYFSVQPEGEQGLQLRLENGAQLLQQGSPDLPMTSSSIIIPDDRKMEVRVIKSTFEEYSDIDVLPSKGNLSRLIDPSTVPYEYGDVYTEDTFFPGNLTELREPYILRDVRGTAVVTYPLQYNPVTKVLRVYTTITVEVYSTIEDDVNILNREELPDTRPREFQNIYESHFINTDRDVRFDYLVDQGNMLIICNEAFLAVMEPFVEWKTLKGIPLEMVGVSEAGGNANAIKSYISDYYYEHGLTFVLLVGDAAQVPSISLGGALSDPSFGFISGNDSYSEVIIGRFSGQTPSQIETQVERTINYERFPTSGDWHYNALGVASNQGPGWGGLSDDEFNEQAICPVLTDYTYGSCQVIADPSGSVSQGMTAINNGVGIINYTGHGYQLGWGNGAALGNSDVHNLTNSGMLPFVITVGCNVGEFDAYDETFAESWQRATHNGNPSGGIVHFGSTISQSWEPPMHGQYGINLILTESYNEHLTRTLGGMATNGCMYMNDMQGSSGINETNYWTYFGDPSVVFTTENPLEITPIFDATILIGQTEFEVSTGNEGDLVALSRDGELLSSGFIGANGTVTLNIEAISTLPSEVELVITGYNHFPFEAVLQVISPDGPYVLFDSFALVSDSDGNGQIDFGEEIQLTFDVENVGVEAAVDVTGSLYSDDPYVSPSNCILTFGTVNAGGISSSQNICSIEILANVPNGHSAVVDINLSDGNNEWQSNFSIEINAPVFEVTNPIVFDENSDGIWDAGETANIQVTYANTGGSDYMWYPGITLVTTSEYVDIQTGSETWYGITAGQSGEINFSVSSDPESPLATLAQFTVTFGPSETNDCNNTPEECPQPGVLVFTATIGVEFDDSLNSPSNLSATAGDFSILVEWEEPMHCPPGELLDCIGACWDEAYLNWIGDGICDDGTWGIYFNCAAYDCDGGDCECGDDPDYFCGDGNCDGGEDSWTCPEDCGDPVTNSCEGNCGGNAGECYCDDSCVSFDDCCDDYEEFCGGDPAVSEGKIYEFYHTWNGERTMELFNASQSYSETRDHLGFNLYRNGSFIMYTEQISYDDLEVTPGVEYCYEVLAVYDAGFSFLSNVDCAMLDTPILMGDLNEDGVINVTDIIVEVSIIILTMIPTDYHLVAGDLNSDGNINVLDIVSIVNIILYGDNLGRVGTGTKGSAIITGHSLILKLDVGIAGFQFEYSGKINSLSSPENWNISNENGIIVGYTSDINLTRKIVLETDGIYQVEELLLSDGAGNGIIVNVNQIPHKFGLNEIYPNPFNPVTHISYNLTADFHVNLEVFDLLGNNVETLVNNVQIAGKYEVNWNADGFPSGMYLVKLFSGQNMDIRKIMLLK